MNLIPVWICIPLSRKPFLSLFLAAEGYSFAFFFRLFLACRHVMLRDGLISPRSKVITALDTSARPGSTISTGNPVLYSLLHC